MPPTIASSRKRVGRPPRVTAERIREAIITHAGEDLTIESLAAWMGVHPSTLYQHVRGQEELNQMAAELLSSELIAPEDRGQHWAVWCVQYAEQLRSALIERPQLLGHFRISHPGTLERAEAFLEVLARSGFSLEESELAIRTVTNWVYGWLGSELETLAGRATQSTFPDMMARQAPDRFPLCHALVAPGRRRSERPSFEDELWIVLCGLAARLGERLAGSYSEALGGAGG